MPPKTNILFKVHKKTVLSINDIAEFDKTVYENNINVLHLISMLLKY